MLHSTRKPPLLVMKYVPLEVGQAIATGDVDETGAEETGEEATGEEVTGVAVG